MARMRRSDSTGPGILRRPRGRGFEYLDSLTGERITDPETLDRIRSLVLPPAWREVWICPWPNGHLQALGTDAAGRRQYRYHDRWRRQKDLEKFDEMLVFARALPETRAGCTQLMHSSSHLTRERVLAASIRLLDQGFFRVGTEEYTEVNDTFGLATIRKDHVNLRGEEVVFEYLAKGSKRRIVHNVDPDVVDIVEALKRRRGGGPELLAYQDGRVWRDVRSDDVNGFIKQLTDGPYSAKDFRTWNATVYAAVGLAVAQPVEVVSAAARRRAKTNVVKEVASLLGNTPAVAKASYIDPRLFDLYDSGLTVAGVLSTLGEDVPPGSPAFQGSVEEAVLALIERRWDSEYVERVKVA